MCRVYWRVFAKIVYSPLLPAILNFCVKCKYVFISEMEQVRVILTKLLSHRDICIVYFRVYTKILLPPLLAAILNFFIKCKNVFILEMERARVILTKSLIHSASAVHLSLFAKILFTPLLAAILNFSIKCVYLGNEASQKFFYKIFDPQGTCIFDWCLLAKIVFPPLLAAILYFCIKHVYFRRRTSYSDFDEIFDPQGMCRVYWWVIAKIVYLPLLAAILNFCAKCKDMFISEMEQVRVILTKLLSHRDICIVYWRVYTKILLPPLLAAILNFCAKCKDMFISEMEQVRVILTKLLWHRDLCIVYYRVFTEILLPPLLAAILNFFIKCKNVFILQMERARAILMKSLIHYASPVYLSLFAKILFPPLLATILNFCIKHVYFGHRTS